MNGIRLNVNEKGVIGLAKVTADFVAQRFWVFTSYSDASPVDLVAADATMRLVRLQVKYREPDPGGVTITVALASVVNGKKIPIDLSKIDGWAIYCPTTENVYYVRLDEVRGRVIRLAISDFNKRSVRLAKGLTDPARLWERAIQQALDTGC